MNQNDVAQLPVDIEQQMSMALYQAWEALFDAARFAKSYSRDTEVKFEIAALEAKRVWHLHGALQKQRGAKVAAYRKKPVVIEAFRWDGSPDQAMPAWADCDALRLVADKPPPGRQHWIEIETLEGVMRANPGDYIIRGVRGELYPCDPDIFAETYDFAFQQDSA